MTEPLIIAGVFTISFILAISLGAGSTGSTPFSPAVGANAITTLKAAFIIGIITFFGAVLQGQNVAETVGTELVTGITLTPIEISIVLLIGAIFMFIGIYTGYPIATAFTFTGAFIGVGLATGGSPVYQLYSQIAVFWIVGPLVAVSISYILIKLLLSDMIQNTYLLPIITTVLLTIIFNINFTIPTIGMVSLQSVISQYVTTTTAIVLTILTASSISIIIGVQLKDNQQVYIKYLLLFLGSVVGFTAGASQVGLAVGALIPLTNSTQLPYISIFILGGLGLLIGAWLLAPRMIKSVSQDYASLGPRRSISALVASFIIAQLAVQLGFPISFNQIMISSIIGSGMGVTKSDSSAVDTKKIGKTILIWISTLVSSYAISYMLISVFLTNSN